MHPETCAPTSTPLRISTLVSPKSFLADINAANKADVLRAIADRAVVLSPSLSAQRIFDLLWEREELGSTGIEAGIAIPHGRIQGIPQPLLVIAKTTAPLDFGAIDEMPSDLFFALLAPTSSNDHLKLLALLARLFQLPQHPDRLRYCRTPEEMYHCLLNWEASLPC